ncbi:MAG: S41 family peptidase [Chloroflexota bacterium]
MVGVEEDDMSLPAFVLWVLTAVQLLGGHLCSSLKWRLMLWAVIVGVWGWQLGHDVILASMVPVYFLLGALFVRDGLLAVQQRQSTHHAFKKTWIKWVGLVFGSFLLLIPLVEAAILPFDTVDYSRRSLTAAFEQMHRTLQTRYPFGEWKQIDWDALYAEHYPAVVEAQSTGDEAGYYVALRKYLFSLPDGHVWLDGPLHDELKTAVIGGGFGFAVIQLNDGRVIAHIIEPFGPADRAGMTWGAEIIRWDGVDVDTAVSSQPILWASRPPATAQNLAITQQHLLTRAPVGSERTVTFRNIGASEAQTVTLTAYNDQFKMYDQSILGEWPSQPQEPVQFQILDNKIGYLKILALDPNSKGESSGDAVADAMALMIEQEAKAIIIDVRGNRGGLDTVVPLMMSNLTPTRLHYEGITHYMPIFDDFRRLTSLYVNPGELQFTNPVFVLIDHRSKSSGEGFGLIAQSLPHVQTVGMYSTDGSFGMSAASILMPNGIKLFYPWGQSLDEAGVIQVEGNHQLQGGIQPDVVIPLTFETAQLIYLEGEDVVLDFVVSDLLR